MDISALLTATAGTGKAANAQPAGKLPADGAFAKQLSQAANAAGLSQLLEASHAKPQANGGGELPIDLAALAERLVEDIANDMADDESQAAALTLIEGVLDEVSGEAISEAATVESPLAALEALLSGNAQANRPLAGAVNLDAGEESALLAEVRQRMALIDAAGRPLAEPGQGNPPSSQRPGAELATLQARPLGTVEGDTRQSRGASNPLLLDPAAAREVQPAGREALAEITQQALRSAAQAAPTVGPSTTASPQPAVGLPQPGSEAPLFAALNGRSEAPSGASGEANGIPAPPVASAQGTTASPQPLGQPPASAALSAPVASQQWQQQLGQQLVNLSQRGDQRVELRLNPAELGPLSVSLKLGENGAQAQFLSAHAQVRVALEQAIPQLREALEEQGISLSEATVGEHAGGEMAFANGGGSGQQGGSASGGEDNLLDDTTEALPGRPLELDGRVDLYA
ncbi:flagellar hook-length control protein FliK [Franzmannia qiaohouensis]|uniref:Flagellar hook-length control protein FliK n=1 Tax=Franzmannia qiaohouensis TaxID=1329370 RepID=A0ABU1HF09_9GAMM|nr:flagellar hook-length control protein FliK [Halomonas qiaohouensis]MDR5906050.1 flagellar hook-length control protein FliK [Halomonas qiaohouensis]